MFTANSMNCLTEALGLALPMNGSLLATHADRGELFQEVGRQIVEITKAYYEQEDATVLPRSIATKAAFENAMSLDIAMGGSTNTVLHLLAAAQEAKVDFTMADIGPSLPQGAPSGQGGALDEPLPHRGRPSRRRDHGASRELDRCGLLDTTTSTVLRGTLADSLAAYDIRAPRRRWRARSEISRRFALGTSPPPRACAPPPCSARPRDGTPGHRS